MQWHSYLWGKTVRKPEDGQADFHHLACHLIDIGVVAEALLAEEQAGHWTRRLAATLGCEPEPLCRILPLLIALHDLGKACPSFQAKSDLHAWRLQDAGAPWPPTIRPRHPHDLELARSLAQLLPELRIFEPAVSERAQRLFYRAVSLGVTAHHGRFFSQQDLETSPEIPALDPVPEDWTGQAEWLSARQWLAQSVRNLLCGGVPPVNCRPGNLSAVAMLLNGFTILCDWIGSDTDYFCPAGFPDLDLYVEWARGAARRAISDHRLLAYLQSDQEPTFSSLFPDRPEIRSVQRSLDTKAAPVLPRQSLVIIEAPMGEGKTEAALLLAMRLAWQHSYQGIYFALPTVATSNQMYDRVKRLLIDLSSSTGRTLLAPVNGLAEFNPDVEEALRSREAGAPAYEEEQTVQYDTWYLPRKRSLLAPYGVGTVDQALLAALNTRHVGLRLLGLSGKVVIVDEVHAYDLFMSRILERLLNWLRELGASVILLSATLPAARRAALLAAFAGEPPDAPNGQEASYPLITVAERGRPIRELPCEASRRSRTVALLRRDDGDAHRRDNAAWLLAEMQQGGRAVWICNTVNEAQAVYLELRALIEQLPQDAPPDLKLFHARFLLRDRQAIERHVLERFGPPTEEGGEPPAGGAERPAILVATQVVEQSLDLDFDLMISQLAPIDLLLQRVGRLHRHEKRTNRGAHREPWLVLLEPPVTPHGPDFARYRKVYSRLILLRTLQALSGRSEIQIPEEIRCLVEAVYGGGDALPEEEAARKAGLERGWFEAALEQHRRAEGRQHGEASIRLLGVPLPNGKFDAAQNEQVDDGAEERGLAMQTRLGDPTVRVVLVDANGLMYARIRAGGLLSREDARQILLRSVSLSYRPLVTWVLAQRETAARAELTPSTFRDTNTLRDMVLLPLRDGSFPWTVDGRSHTLRLEADLGVRYDSEQEIPDAFSPA